MGWLWLLWIAGWIAAADCIRRPAWQWDHASRSKGFWIVSLTLLGPLMIWCFLAACLPRLVSAGRAGVGDDRFVKSS